MRLDHLLSKVLCCESGKVTGRHRLKSALSSFEGILPSIRNPAYAGKPKRSGSNPDSRLLFTENYTEEIQRKSIVNAKAFTSLRSIHWETDGKKNRMDFPEECENISPSKLG